MGQVFALNNGITTFLRRKDQIIVPVLECLGLYNRLYDKASADALRRMGDDEIIGTICPTPERIHPIQRIGRRAPWRQWWAMCPRPAERPPRGSATWKKRPAYALRNRTPYALTPRPEPGPPATRARLAAGEGQLRL